MNILNNIDVFIENILNALGIFGPILGCILIIIESILPILPLSVFVTLNFYAFGNIMGFIISYCCTILGCMISYVLVRKGFKSKFDRFMDKKDRKKLKKYITSFNKIKLENLCILIAIPFTPAFLVNIAAALSDISKKKFWVSLLIGKLFMVYFWGYVGVTLIDSLKNPVYFIKILVLVLIAYIIGKIVKRKVGVE